MIHKDTKKYVYFIQNGVGGPIKIGVTNNPLNRLRALQTGSPWPYILLGVVSDQSGLPSSARYYEQWLHKKFARFRLDGEWFDPVPEVLAFIKDPHSDHWPRWSLVNIKKLPPRTKKETSKAKGKPKARRRKKPTSRYLWQQILTACSDRPAGKIGRVEY